MNAASRIALRIAAIGVAGMLIAPVATASAATGPALPEAQSIGEAAGSAVPMEPMISTLGEWAAALLRQAKWPVTGSNVCALSGWAIAEGGHFTARGARFNPLNTTQGAPDSTIFNSVGVRNYPDWSVGLSATLTTLNLPAYTAIRFALATGNNALAVLAAVDASPWGTKSKNPASWLSGACQALGAEFDAARSRTQSTIDDASHAVGTAQMHLDASVAAQARLEKNYQQMAGDIAAAQQHLNGFARTLYIGGVEPSLASEVEGITSGDPIAYDQVQQYAGYAGSRDAIELQLSIDLLAEVGANRDKATAAVASARSALADRQQELLRAQQRLLELEQKAFTV